MSLKTLSMLGAASALMIGLGGCASTSTTHGETAANDRAAAQSAMDKAQGEMQVWHSEVSYLYNNLDFAAEDLARPSRKAAFTNTTSLLLRAQMAEQDARVELHRAHDRLDAAMAQDGTNNSGVAVAK